jgi:alpha-ketoglutarate-dependent 2,4-dichlorophenoxyacetate dioxygenase
LFASAPVLQDNPHNHKGFAAEVRGVPIGEVAAGDATYAAVRAAFEEHSVLVFRGEDFSNESQLAFSCRFGPPEIYGWRRIMSAARWSIPCHLSRSGRTLTKKTGLALLHALQWLRVGSIGTHWHVVILTTIGPDGKVAPPDSRLALQNKANQLWHTDSSFKRVPALTSILSARIIPANGGETEFVSTRLAYDRLDPALRRLVDNSFAWHHYAHSRGMIAPDLASEEERAKMPPVCWRMVWKNPVNGRNALYLASHAYAVEGMQPVVGKKLIDDLTAIATAPDLSYVHQWKSGDVVMWDNRATMHRGRPWPAHEARYMVRTTISATEADGLASVRPSFLQAAE